MSDLDRYGLFALVVIILLIIFVTLTNDKLPEDDPETTVLSLEAALEPGGEGSSPPGAVEPGTEKEPFDFMEGGVNYPGSDGGGAGTEPPQAGADSFYEHKVEKRDTLSSISKKYYGSTIHWRTIESANEGIDPMKLKVGSTIRVPKRPGSFAKPTNTAPKTGSDRLHEVKKNDNLRKISRLYYGTENKWKSVFEANRDKISNPDRLAIGTFLVIPQ